MNIGQWSINFIWFMVWYGMAAGSYEQYVNLRVEIPAIDCCNTFLSVGRGSCIQPISSFRKIGITRACVLLIDHTSGYMDKHCRPKPQDRHKTPRKENTIEERKLVGEKKSMNKGKEERKKTPPLLSPSKKKWRKKDKTTQRKKSVPVTEFSVGRGLGRGERDFRTFEDRIFIYTSSENTSRS